MKRTEVIREFCESVAPQIPRGDKPAFREAWNNFTDALQKDRQITERQYNTWVGPRGDRCPRARR